MLKLVVSIRESHNSRLDVQGNRPVTEHKQHCATGAFMVSCLAATSLRVTGCRRQYNHKQQQRYMMRLCAANWDQMLPYRPLCQAGQTAGLPRNRLTPVTLAVLLLTRVPQTETKRFFK